MPEPTEVPDADLAQLVIDLRRQADAAEARWLEAVAELDQRELWRTAGAASVAVWLHRECRLTTPAAKAAVTVAAALRQLPVTAAAFRSGQIGYEHVRAIAPAVEDECARTVDPIFARAAGWMNPRQIRNVVRAWTRIRGDERA